MEARHQPYVVAVASNQCVWVGLTQSRVKTLAAQEVPAKAWRRLTVGAGVKGPRRFEWARVPINHPYDARHWQRWLLVRRSCHNPEDLTFYLAFGPAGTSLEVLARVAGRRWAVEEAFAQGKGEVGLDEYEVRSSWVGWHRHMTLAMAALALLGLTRARLFARPASAGPTMGAFKKKRGLGPAVVAGS